MIRCTDVHKSYRLGDRTVPAVRGATLQIDKPGFYGLMGPSGSGKSTLLHLLAGLDRPDEGEIDVDGKRLDTLNEAGLTAYRRESIGIIFQQFNLISTMSARENVALPGILAGKNERELSARADDLLSRLGLEGRGDHRPDALSGGEQQRVAIARALLFEPSLILADEPTGNLDSASSERLWALLADVARERDTTILMVTHEPAAAAHCRTVYCIRDGVISGHINTEDLDASGVAAEYQRLGRSA
ncbi:MAG: ABC transporter ATP-binding protein [Planctomycetota bacterium]